MLSTLVLLAVVLLFSFIEHRSKSCITGLLLLQLLLFVLDGGILCVPKVTKCKCMVGVIMVESGELRKLRKLLAENRKTGTK